VVGILSVAPALPAYRYAQVEITEPLVESLGSDEKTAAVIRRIHGATGVESRSLVLPLEAYRDIRDFTVGNRLFREQGLPLVVAATQRALDDAGVDATDVDYLFFTTVTGVGAPSLDVELAQAMGFRPDVKRVPSFGLGCVAGAAGLARVNDLLRGDAGAIAVLVSLELCSLTIQWDDASMANIVGTGLFGDGAAALVLAGADRSEEPIAWIRGTRSALYPDSTETIGWNIGSYGFRLMLTPAVPELIDRHLAEDVDALLAAHGLGRADVDEWLAHPGGPRVLEAFSEALDLAPGDLATSWDVLAESGNLSSSAVLHVLARHVKNPPGHRGLLFALGPGVSVEMVLLEWR
jgi:alkylresorcinol/alkylpyrone synthase